MKKILPILSLIFASMAYAQSDDPSDYPVATCSDEFCVQLDDSQAVQEFYQIDITPFNFSTFEEAYKEFGRISNNRLTYNVNIDDQIVVLHVHLDRTEEPKDIVWWNDYLNSLCGL